MILRPIVVGGRPRIPIVPRQSGRQGCPRSRVVREDITTLILYQLLLVVVTFAFSAATPTRMFRDCIGRQSPPRVAKLIARAAGVTIL